MRVTQNMLTQNFLYNITSTNQQMQKLENELSTGKTLNQPSDNPVAVAQDMAVRADLSQTTGYQSTINTALSWMNNTSSALQNIISALQGVQTDVTTAMNGTNQTPAGLTALGEDVAGLQHQVESVLDTQQGASYLFGGSNNTAPQSGNYAISNGSIQYQIGSASTDLVTVNVTANQIMNTGTSGLENTLNQIGSDLNSQNTANLSSDLQNLESNLNNVININAQVGANIQQATAMQNQLNQYATTMSNEKGVIEGANMAQVITQFQTDQTVYTAALQMGSYLLLPSLSNYLPNG
ncbi:flagellin [Alicyclobacillaceae bacterium I2511]|nr:flagellin [Alicyclobacillaceae bacterium I2511]